MFVSRIRESTFKQGHSFSEDVSVMKQYFATESGPFTTSWDINKQIYNKQIDGN